jgi:hypothetical protein
MTDKADHLNEVRRGIGHWYAEHPARDCDTLGLDAAVVKLSSREVPVFLPVMEGQISR